MTTLDKVALGNELCELLPNDPCLIGGRDQEYFRRVVATWTFAGPSSGEAINRVGTVLYLLMLGLTKLRSPWELDRVEWRKAKELGPDVWQTVAYMIFQPHICGRDEAFASGAQSARGTDDSI